MKKEIKKNFFHKVGFFTASIGRYSLFLTLWEFISSLFFKIVSTSDSVNLLY